MPFGDTIRITIAWQSSWSDLFSSFGGDDVGVTFWQNLEVEKRTCA